MKKGRTLLAVALLLLLLAGCSGSGKQETQSVQTAADTAGASEGSLSVKKGTELVWWYCEPENFSAVFEQAAAEYNASQERIRVTAVPMGSARELTLALEQADQLPDVISFGTESFSGLVANGLLQELDTPAQKTGYDLNSFEAQAGSLFRAQGQQRALPFLHSVPVLYVNETAARSNGIDTSRQLSFAQFCELVRNGAAISTMDSGTILAGWKARYLEPFFVHEGIVPMAQDGSTELTKGDAVKVTQTLLELVREGSAEYTYGAGAAVRAEQSFLSQKTLTMTASSMRYPFLAKDSGFSVAMSPYPSGSSNGSTALYGVALGITAEEENQKNAAWSFLQYLTSPTQSIRFFEETGSLPLRSSGNQSIQPAASDADSPAVEGLLSTLQLTLPDNSCAANPVFAERWIDVMNEIMAGYRDPVSGLSYFGEMMK